MAVRDEEQQATVEQARVRLPWRDTLGHVPAILLVGGLFMYAYLSICYDRFYGSLGVDPNDVGLSYAGTLARSSGFAIGFLASSSIFAMAFDVLRIGAAEQRRKGATTAGQWMQRVQLLGMIVLAAIVAVTVLTGPVLDAGRAARDVRQGKPVGLIQFRMVPWDKEAWPRLSVLAIHAAPATVEPAGKPSDSPAAERLRGRKLLYLGQSGGTVVLYHADGQRAVYVPASSVILHVANCDAKPPPDSTCGTAGR